MSIALGCIRMAPLTLSRRGAAVLRPVLALPVLLCPVLISAILALSLPASAQEPAAASNQQSPTAPTEPSQADGVQGSAPVSPVPASPVPAPDSAPMPGATQITASGSEPTSSLTSAPASSAPPVPQNAASNAAAAPPAQPSSKVDTAQQGATTEEDLKKLLVGKLLYLRAGYLDDNLSFNEHGVLTGHSPQGSYTLSGVSVEKVRLTKHKVELEGQRYGLHFLGALPSEDPTTAMDRVLITPKKKILKISIDRETLINPKKIKEKPGKAAAGISVKTSPVSIAPALSVAPAEDADETSQAKAEIAATPEAERPADPGSVTTTTSPAHAAALLNQAIDHVFSVGFDDRMMAAMPDFWKLYYQAAAAHADYRPQDPAVLRQSAVDKKGKLISVFEPASNEFAQAHGVAGLALYHVVIAADGKPGEIAVARPIGFGLDESAVSSIRKASFEPAIKDGKPVPVLLDLIVEFHIYSARTGTVVKSELPPAPKESTEAEDQPNAPLLPGPYSVQHPSN